jgi:hypothetical protein
MSAKIEVEAAVMSIRDNPDDGTARVNLRWEGHHRISDCDLAKLGSVLNSEDETEHSGWALVERPVKAMVGNYPSETVVFKVDPSIALRASTGSVSFSKA